MGVVVKQNKQYNKLVIGFMLLGFMGFFACDFINSAETQYTTKDFPLSIELDKTCYKVGDMVSFKLTIANNYGKDVIMYSNGKMPCADFQRIDNRLMHVETAALTSQKFKKNETHSRSFSFFVGEAGKYVLDAHYNIAINNQGNSEGWFVEKLDDIEIMVTPL